uniref:C2H2-type domain-containing protein n=1 Tax=Tetraselmis sp. GSL018 TaxID=582737 RepID=A0A061RGX5_9CHLO|eukprot:CAMPEP_0177578460 /NCGR_PEP_ID=MMETSP0419_2-20121207/361_1 /TAXON_ID=582737 /ORGANISM="Tetraselmis sp., Strain GSL018" /LENGTH=101 /DNA_ID=CAMNT_0019066907 /DNA_START=147 /DNA_END=452 /DNA_ORIENTATION=+
MGKAKPAKHTTKEINKKISDATTNKGGGKAGYEDRKGGKAGHAKYRCPNCATQCPSLSSMKIHWEAKHSKEPFDESKCIDVHAEVGGTTKGVAVRGSTKKK